MAAVMVGRFDAGVSTEISRTELRRQGLTDRQVNLLLRTHRLLPVRRGIHMSQPPDDRAELQAVLLTHRRELVVSHLSAAQLHGLPKPLSGWRRPEFTAENGSPRGRPDLRISVAELPPSQVGVHHGLPATSTARTVVDCARSLPARDSLAIADAALNLRMTTPAEILTVLASQHRWPGSARARTVLDLMDGRRESPLESWSAWAFKELSLPRPQWQMILRTDRGRFLGRCDAWWPGVAGEADGRSKYRLSAAERGGADADTLFAILDRERARESGFRSVDAEVIRWESAEVLRPNRAEDLATRIRRAITRADNGRHFTGRVTG